MSVFVCPKCNTGTSEIKFRGPVLWAEGVAALDPDTNKLASISPVKAVQTIQAGKELDDKSADHMLFMCGECGYEGTRAGYKIMQSCALTGIATDRKVSTLFGAMYIIPELVDKAAEIFSASNSAWVTPFDDEDFQ